MFSVIVFVFFLKGREHTCVRACRMKSQKLQKFFGLEIREDFQVGRPPVKVRLHLLFAYMHIWCAYVALNCFDVVFTVYDALYLLIMHFTCDKCILLPFLLFMTHYTC
jgi:hypothetical protein